MEYFDGFISFAKPHNTRGTYQFVVEVPRDHALGVLNLLNGVPDPERPIDVRVLIRPTQAEPALSSGETSQS